MELDRASSYKAGVTISETQPKSVLNIFTKGKKKVLGLPACENRYLLRMREH